jgi:glycosyltransferase involved in cell wall biosynthesis
VTLIGGGPLAGALEAAGVQVDSLAMRPGRPDPRAIGRLSRLLRHEAPDVVVTWMYHSNLVGGLAAKLAGRIPVVWNIRHTVLDPRRSKRITRWTARMGGLLARRVPQAIVYVAHAAESHHAARGYGGAPAHVIPNGFDLNEFRPDPGARVALRRELGVSESTLLVGIVGRFHPDKDHRTFLAAAERIHAARGDVRFILCGDGVTRENAQLAAWAHQAGVADVTHFLGRRDDMPRVAGAFDLAACSSLTEAFPRAVGEAMACGVPAVVTDVGDAAHLVGATGRVVNAGRPDELAGAVLGMLAAGSDQRRALGRAARSRIAKHFSIDAVLSRHMELWLDVAASGSKTGFDAVSRGRRAA